MSYEERKQFFEDKQSGKLERFQELAEKKKQQSDKTLDHAKNMSDQIPFGQPILIGHHSEKRDRRFRDKIDKTYQKAFELSKTSKYYEEKAERIENNHNIKSDDPDAIKKLEEKLNEIEKEIEQVKDHNKKCSGFVKLSAFQTRNGYVTISNTNGNYKRYASIIDGVLTFESKRTPENIKKIIENYHKTGKLEQPEIPKDKIKFDSYVLQNLNGNKTRIKERIEALQSVEKTVDFDETINNIRFFSDKVENRVKIEFPSIPSEEIRTQLKQNGFHWSPYNKTWQRMLNNSGLYAMDRIKELTK